MLSSSDHLSKKKSKLSRSKKTGKNESTCKAKVPVKSVFEITDLNESCDFKEPMPSSRKDPSSTDQYNLNHGNHKDSLEFGPKASEDVSKEDPIEIEETVLCQVCNKDISHMNSIRRQQHVNRCIDKTEENEREERKQAEQLDKVSRKTFQDCPMCRKSFKSSNTRQTHLKRCATINNISTEEMLKLVKQQEQEASAVPSTSTDQVSKTSKTSKTGQAKKRKIISEPKSQFDADVQLALAVSSSLNQLNKSEADILEENVKGISGQGKRRKKKNMMEDACLLTTLTEESKQRRVEKRLQSVLFAEVSDESDTENSPELQESSLNITRSKTDRQLWRVSNQQDDTRDARLFYVSSLMPPIVTNKLPMGSRLKRLSSIPGREVSFSVDSLDKSVMPSDLGDDMFTASTQTAVVLAELAVDDTVINNEGIDHTSPPEISFHSSGFLEERLSLKEDSLSHSRRQTLQAFKQMINQPEFSDLSIKTLDGDEVYGHKVILLTRFPALIKLLDSTQSSISLPLSKDATLDFLTYIYTGELGCTPSVQHELVELSDKINLQSLKETCSSLMTRSSKSTDENTIEDPEHSKFDEDVLEVYPVLNMKDVWGESDSETDDILKDKEKGYTDTECEMDTPEVICDEDYYDIMCTQKRRNSINGKRISDKTDSEADSQNVSKTDNDSDSDQLSDFLKNDTAMNLDNSQETRECEDSDKERSDNSIDKPRKVDDSKDPTASILNQNDTEENCDTYLMEDVEPFEVLNPDHHQEDDGKASVSRGEMEVVDNGKLHGEKTAEPEMPMDTSNVDLFHSPSSPVPSDQNSPVYDSPTSSRSPLFNKKSKQNINQISGVINLDFESGDEIEMELSASECDENAGNKFENTSSKSLNQLIHQCDTSKETNKLPVRACLFEVKLDSDNRRKDKVSISPQKREKDQRNSTHVDINQIINNDDDDDNDGHELEILGDNLDEIKTKSRKIKEVSYLGRSICSHDSDSMTERDDRVQCYPDKSDTMEESPSKGIEPNNTNSQLNDNNISLNKWDATEVSSKSVRDSEKMVESDVELISDDGSVFDGQDAEEVCQSVVAPLDISHNSFDGNHADVWDDFDDCGIEYPEVPSPVISQKFPSDNNLSNGKEDITLIELQGTDNAEDFFNQSDPGVFDDKDDSFVFNINKKIPHDVIESTKFKTPTANNSKRTNKKKEWIPPSPFTPMPDYDKMNTPILKREVKKFGVKAVSKKRMVTVLKDIYHKTHQYETDSEFEDDLKNEPDENEDDLNHLKLRQDDEIMSQETLPSSQDSYSSCDLPEESILLSESTSDSDAQSSPQKSVDIRKRLHTFFSSDQDLHRKVLLYEPLEIDILKTNLKEAGIKCGMNKLMEFLDEKCIAFTSKNSRKKRAPSKRGKKKTTTKQ